MFSNCSSPKASHVSLPVLLLTRRKTHPIQIALEQGNEEKNPNKPQLGAKCINLCSFSSTSHDPSQQLPQSQQLSTQGHAKVTWGAVAELPALHPTFSVQSCIAQGLWHGKSHLR